MQKINFKKDKIPFTQVANEVLNDKNLSFKAKGLYAFLYSKPEGWDFAIDRISLESTDGRKGINSGLQELEQHGYLTRQRKKTGRVVYLLKSQMSQMDIGPDVPKGKVPKRQSAEKGTVSNKDIKVIKNISNTDTEQSSEKSKGQIFQDYVEALKELNPVAYTKWFKNTTQRANVELLIKQFSVGQVTQVVKFVVANRGKEFFPNPTTPNQLVDALPKIEAYYKSKGYKKKGKEIAGL